MPNARDINKRIKSVKNTQQITKAMKMVSSVRLLRAQERALATAPYTERLERLVYNLAATVTDEVTPLLQERHQIKRVCYIVIGADKGLAGGFTSNLMKVAVKVLEQQKSENYDVVAIGRKTQDYLKNNHIAIFSAMDGFSDKPAYEHAKAIARKATKRFLAEDIDEVYVVYTHFMSALQQEVRTTRLLPAVEKTTDREAINCEYIFTPDSQQVLALLVPQYVETVVYNALLQSAASELGSRMIAMTAATDNAGELIDQLTLHYNKVRQSGITNEISEIVSGANALE
jgi:F-type H+-transporting ATPase subunit gamma